jgi:hypothetical protein
LLPGILMQELTASWRNIKNIWMSGNSAIAEFFIT